MEQWIAELSSITSAFVLHFNGLSEKELNWKPETNAWSIAQNIEHLIVFNESYYPILASLHAGTYSPPFTARIGFLVNLVGKTLLNAVRGDRRNKMKTFPIWQPTESQISRNILHQFETHQKELAQKMAEAKDLVAHNVVICSPANSAIVYKLSTAFDLIVAHEKRHLEQAKEVLALIKRTNIF